MASRELENLVRLGRLKHEPATEAEIEGLTRSGESRLADAGSPGLSLESRFDLAYNAVHALALVALRRLGYRSESVHFAFQTLPYTLRIAPEKCQVLAKCQELKGLYEQSAAAAQIKAKRDEITALAGKLPGELDLDEDEEDEEERE